MEVELHRFTERQKAVVDGAVARRNRAQTIAKAMEDHVDELLSMISPEGATRLDLDEGVFYGEVDVKLDLVRSDELTVDEMAEVAAEADEDE